MECEGREWGGKRREGERKAEGERNKKPLRIGLVTGLPSLTFKDITQKS